jgi:uncharacterized membrane protein YbhN (UPF0104 family)
MLSRLRSSRLLRVALALVALGFLGWGLARNWEGTAAAVGRLSWWSVAAAAAAVLAGMGGMLVAWQRVLAGLGSTLPLPVAARVLYVGQLGKYVPGSVWAFAAMIELAREHGSPPRRTFSATVLGLAVSLGCAAALAAATLATQEAARQVWYLVLVIPLVVVGLHPRVLTWGLNLALRVARKEPLDRVLPGSALVAAAAWTLGGWALYGVHLWALLPGGVDLLPLAAGSYALAWVTGILTVVVPAGIGVREGAMTLVLAPVVGAPTALVAAVASRLVFTFGDLAWAGLGFLLGRLHARRHPAPAPATPEPATTAPAVPDPAAG